MILVIRISGMVEVDEKIEEALFRLRLRRKYSAVLLKETKENLILLKKVRDFIAFGTIDQKTLELLIEKRAQPIKDKVDVKKIMDIESEMNVRVKQLEQQGKLAEAQRLQKRVLYDTKMIAETGFVNGIENYSPYFEKRLDGSPPNTLFDYFPDDFLLIVDESHMTLPQLRAMPQGDFSRKTVLIEHGFRLPTAIHHRPIKFEELSYVL